MELTEMFDYIADLVARAAAPAVPDDSAGPGAATSTTPTADAQAEQDFELRKLALLSRARLVLDIIEAQVVHDLRARTPAVSYDQLGAAQGISKQASRIRHTKLEQILKVHQLDGRRHSMAKTVVPARHRRAAKPTRRARRERT